MTSAYTPLLGLVLPVTGELSGTWGTVWNDSGTSLIDAAIAGTTTISADADVTLTTTQGAANTSREAIILWTAGGTVTRTITVPAQSKIYTVINKTSSTQSIKVVGAGPTTGVTIIAGESAVIAWNGVDFIKISNTSGSGVFSSITNTGLTSGRVVYSTTGGLETDSANLTFNGTTLTANTLNLTNQLTTAYGGTGLTSYTAGDLPYYATGTALSKLGIGTNGQILTSSGSAPQWSTLSGVAVTTFSAGTTGLTPNSATSGAVTLGGTLATTNGGTGLTSFTANGVVYASSASALATGSALTFDGTNLRNLGGAVASGGTTDGKFRFDRNDGATNLAYLDWVSADNGLRFYNNNGGYFVWSQSAAGELMRLTTTGLGIGTSSPTVKLDIVGTAYQITNGAGASGSRLRFETPASSGGSYIQFYKDLTPSYVAGIGTVLPGGSAASAMVFSDYQGSWVERMRLDSSGNLGLGVTPSAWSSGKAIEVGFAGRGLWGLNQTVGYSSTNAYYNGGWKYGGTGAAAAYGQDAGSHLWQTAASGTAGNAITFTQAMTLDANGNLCVGSTSVTNVSGYKTISLQGSTQGGIFESTTGSYTTKTRMYSTDSGGFVGTASNHSLGFLTNDTQRFVIGTSGQLGIGASPSYGSSGQVLTSGGSGAAPTWSDAAAPAAGKLLASGNINSSTGTVTLTWATTGVKRIRVFLAGASANNSGQIYNQVGHTTSVVSSSNYRFSGQMIQSASITAYSQTTQSQWMVTGGSTQWPVNMVAEIGLGSDGRPCCFATATMTSEPRWFQMGGDFSTTWTTAQFQSVRVWFDGSATYSGRVTVVGYTE